MADIKNSRSIIIKVFYITPDYKGTLPLALDLTNKTKKIKNKCPIKLK